VAFDLKPNMGHDCGKWKAGDSNSGAYADDAL